MSQQGSHIPKFGSWDADNVPYTAYFENARKDKGSGVMMNPNDPEENPDAFMMFRGGNNNDHKVKAMVSESNSEKSTSTVSDYSTNKQTYKSDRKKGSNVRSGNFYPPSPGPNNRPKHGYNPADDIASHRSASVPMFGAWDENDPRSGDGFTVIFQKVKEEKHIAATKFPPIPQQPTTYDSNAAKSRKSKKWCCGLC